MSLCTKHKPYIICNLHEGVLAFATVILLPYSQVSSSISSMRHSVSSPDETLRGELKIRRAAEYFSRTSRCFIRWWNTVSNAWDYFSNESLMSLRNNRPDCLKRPRHLNICSRDWDGHMRTPVTPCGTMGGLGDQNFFVKFYFGHYWDWKGLDTQASLSR